MTDARARNAERMRRVRAQASELGELPEVANPERRESCRHDFRKFCETYRSGVFHFGWSDDHLSILASMERNVLGKAMSPLMALAMPRGSGKTTISITAAIWALLYGHRHWVCLVGATSGKSEALLKSIKTELRFNPEIVADFPEVCYPIGKLEGRANRAAGQKVNGQETNIQWLSDKLIFPTVDGSESSGSVVSVCGITGDIRGQQETRATGDIIRPDFVICDDPQTRESAGSEKQCQDRIDTIMSDILGLAGPGSKISCVMPCTVIKRYDMADRMLGDEFPDWESIRTQMLYGEAKNTGLIDTYLDIRDTSIRNGLGPDEANAYWKENQEKLEKGLVAGWADRYNDDEVSPIQHAINLKARSEAAFLSEYQNQPADEETAGMLSVDEITQKQHAEAEGMIPEEAVKLVAFADVQGEALYWVLTAFDDKFNGFVVSYGTVPEQRDRSLRYRDLRVKLSKKHPGAPLEVKLRYALEELEDTLLNKTYQKPSGDTLEVSRLMIDANWGASRDIIYNWVKSNPRKSKILPSHGKFVGASTEPLNANQSRQQGKRIGVNWRTALSKEMPVRYCLYDVNYWKSFFWERMNAVVGSRGCVTIFKMTPRDHLTFAQNLRSEYSVKVEGRGRVVDEWKLKPGEDNHYLDCVVGCFVAASVEGITEKRQTEAPQRQPVKRTRVRSL